ncbi:MAG: cytochrome P450 [Lachnospiraceae bacterium]|nr:cytochrome P450 [Lachnospiraceae bacterium]
MAEEIRLPHEKGLDHTMDLLREGYLFLSNRRESLHSQYFTVRLMGKKMICLNGKEAAALFYREDYFKRQGVAPMRVQKTLFGKSAIQGLDGEEHKRRKELFMTLLTGEYEDRLLAIIATKLENALTGFEKRETINLFRESRSILLQSVCEWAGIPLKEKEKNQLIRDFTLMIYSFGRVGKVYREGKKARKRVEAWVQNVVEAVRLGHYKADKESPLVFVCSYQDSNGNLLDANMAAIELINLLRPIFAIATYVVFTALALKEHPECKEALEGSDPVSLHYFCQEVRRYYPFSPFIGAKVKKNFIWKGIRFPKGTIVLLDLYGTDHDPAIWGNPFEFWPSRFDKREGGLYDFIPQGGGNIRKGHRCAGDMITVKIMELFLNALANKITYTIPDQDLSYSLSQIPTLPSSGFIMENVKRK